MFRKVLVANRGEIAVRIIRGLREMGIRNVAVFSEADRKSLHVRMADEACAIGPAAASESYLNVERIIEAAQRHEAEAIHPGYGFLSENADFAAACDGAGIVFIGPPAESIRKLGSKIEARLIADATGVPVVPGTREPLANAAEARDVAQKIGYPILLKAAAGGGGKGMRRVDAETDLESAFRDAASEAERSFKSGDLYLERALIRPRHIEIQILGDQHGNLVHLGERECSLQRRHQKVLEECPSPLVALHPEMRDAMGEAALKVARFAGYYNAGTAEFLVDQDGKFYFLEMNTRLQVEHPVTELVTGLDLVHLQLHIAAGGKLPFMQDDVCWTGHAIECRVYAENADAGFMPSPGKIAQLHEPSGPGVRVDSGVYSGWTVPIDYDPMLSKVTVWSSTRESAIRKMLRAMQEYVVLGIETNVPFFAELLRDEQFKNGALHTGFLAEFLERRVPRQEPSREVEAALASVALAAANRSDGHSLNSVPPSSEWLRSGRNELLR